MYVVDCTVQESKEINPPFQVQGKKGRSDQNEITQSQNLIRVCR